MNAPDHNLGLDLARVTEADVFFAATGVTTGELLDGVRYLPDGAETHTVVMRGKTGTIRFMQARHRFDRVSTSTDLYDVSMDSNHES